VLSKPGWERGPGSCGCTTGDTRVGARVIPFERMHSPAVSLSPDARVRQYAGAFL